MAPQDASKIVDELRPTVHAAAKNLLHHAYGADGLPWGTPFEDLEDLAVRLGKLLSTELVQHALRRQAATPPPDGYGLCPSCGGPVTPRSPELHETSTRAGPVAWDEPATSCPACRRAFFPSDPQPGP